MAAMAATPDEQPKQSAAVQPAPKVVLPVNKEEWLRPLNVGIEIETCLLVEFKPLSDPFAFSDEEDEKMHASDDEEEYVSPAFDFYDKNVEWFEQHGFYWSSSLGRWRNHDHEVDTRVFAQWESEEYDEEFVSLAFNFYDKNVEWFEQHGFYWSSSLGRWRKHDHEVDTRVFAQWDRSILRTNNPVGWEYYVSLRRFQRSLKFFKQTSDSSLVGWNQDYDYFEPNMKPNTYGVEFIQCFDKAQCTKCPERIFGVQKPTLLPIFKQVFFVVSSDDDEDEDDAAAAAAEEEPEPPSPSSFQNGDALICKECSAHFNIPIWDGFPVQPQKFFEPNMQANILREVRTILSNSRECELNRENKPSAGLHVHMSHPIVTKQKYPDFGDFIMWYWRTKLQDKMVRKWTLRTDSKYCHPNRQEHDSGMCDEKYLMMNILNSHNDGETLWHVEFRGFHALNPNAPGAVLELQEYVEDLGSLFAGACEVFVRHKQEIFGEENKKLLLRVPRSNHIIWQQKRGRSEDEWVFSGEEPDESSDEEESAAGGDKKSAAGGDQKRRRLELVDLFPNLRL